MAREPALLTSAGRMPKRSQHRVSEGQRAPIRRRRIGRRRERPAPGHGQPRTVAHAIVGIGVCRLSDGFRNRWAVQCRSSLTSDRAIHGVFHATVRRFSRLVWPRPAGRVRGHRRPCRPLGVGRWPALVLRPAVRSLDRHPSKAGSLSARCVAVCDGNQAAAEVFRTPNQSANPHLEDVRHAPGGRPRRLAQLRSSWIRWVSLSRRRFAGISLSD